MLAQSVLLAELRRFADPSFAQFAGWPLGKPDARHKWAHAFFVYVRDMVDTAPVLTPTAVTLAFTGVEAAFFASLTLENATATEAAIDFADAWKAAIDALAAGSAATDPSSTSFTFAAMDAGDVTTRRAALQADLLTAFTTPRSTRLADLDEIAAAFHRATLGLRSTATPYVVTYG